MAGLHVQSGQVFGQYQAMEFIASGGFSEVWSACDSRSNRIAALKIIPGSQDEDGRQRFGREASLIARLDHPNIVPLLDYGETSDAYYLVTPYIIGKSLAQILETGALSIGDSISLMLCMAQALDYVHENNLVHRDFKPGNLLLDVNGIAYLTDFGLARALSESTYQAHSTAGTLIYMPPEQFTGGELTPYADQYSFGIVLYRLLSGQLPYEGKIPFGMRQIHSRESLPDITAINPKLPPAVNTILWRLTGFAIDERPTRLEDTMNALVRILKPDTDTLALSSAPTQIPEQKTSSRQAEIARLLRQIAPPWQQGAFAMRLTHFIQLDILIGGETARFDDSVHALMLRAALQYDQQVEKWSQVCSDSARRQACFHALYEPHSAIWLRALRCIAPTDWAKDISPDVLNRFSSQLMPPSDTTVLLLAVLAKALPERTRWQNDRSLAELDTALSALADSDSPLAHRAAKLLGLKRRTQAFLALKQDLPRLIAYEAAGTAPASTPVWERLRLTLQLVFQQNTRERNQAIRDYLWSALGATGALSWLIYNVFRSTDFLSSRRLLNTLGNGLLFGLLYGLSIWAGRHFAERSAILPRWLRMALAITLGGLIFALSAMLFQQLVYDDVLSWPVALLSGLLFVGGFVISAGLAQWVQIISGACGVIAALLIPWSYYLNDGTRAPFIFDESHPNSAIVVTVGAAALLSMIVYVGSRSRWFKPGFTTGAVKSGLASGIGLVHGDNGNG